MDSFTRKFTFDEDNPLKDEEKPGKHKRGYSDTSVLSLGGESSRSRSCSRANSRTSMSSVSGLSAPDDDSDDGDDSEDRWGCSERIYWENAPKFHLNLF